MDEPDGGEAAADACLRRLRDFQITRDTRLEPEYEAARANLYMEFAEFAGWFPVQHRLHHRYDAGPYKPLSDEEVKAAYERFSWGRSDYW